MLLTKHLKIRGSRDIPLRFINVLERLSELRKIVHLQIMNLLQERHDPGAARQEMRKASYEEGMRASMLPARVPPSKHLSVLTNLELPKPFPFGFSWELVTQARVIKSLALGDHLGLQASHTVGFPGNQPQFSGAFQKPSH